MSWPMAACGPDSVVMKPILTFCCASTGVASQAMATSVARSLRVIRTPSLHCFSLWRDCVGAGRLRPSPWERVRVRVREFFPELADPHPCPLPEGEGVKAHAYRVTSGGTPKSLVIL